MNVSNYMIKICKLDSQMSFLPFLICKSTISGFLLKSDFSFYLWIFAHIIHSSMWIDLQILTINIFQHVCNDLELFQNFFSNCGCILQDSLIGSSCILIFKMGTQSFHVIYPHCFIDTYLCVFLVVDKDSQKATVLNQKLSLGPK